MSPSESGLAAKWKRVADDLGIDVVAPFELLLASGVRIHVPVLICRFGGPKGMLVVPDDDYGASITGEWLDEAVTAGYGYSVMSEPRIGEEYERNVSIEVLADWGWHGPESAKPDWLEGLDVEAE